MQAVAPGSEQSYTFGLFVGPKLQDQLEAAAIARHQPPHRAPDRLVRAPRSFGNTATFNDGIAVVVLNDEAVRRYFGGRPAIGEPLRIDEEAPRTVVGVVAGMRLFGPERAVRPEAYVPLAQAGNISVSGSLVVRSSGPPAGLTPAVKNAIWSAMPGVVIPDAVLERMRVASGRGREHALAEGIAIARETFDQVRDVVRGIQVSAPFGKVELALEVLAHARENASATPMLPAG